MGYFLSGWVLHFKSKKDPKGRVQIVERALMPTGPDPPLVRSALASIARRETTCGMTIIVKRDGNDVSDSMCQVASQTSVILITQCLFIACCS